MNTEDTIAAVATPSGLSAIAIVRLAGPAALSIAKQLTGAQVPARQSVLRKFKSLAGELIDTGIVVSYPGPNSYTGDDIVEFQTHGSSVVTDWLLETLCHAGARLAEPGEFTLRAFLNDKLDLSQAEAVVDLINSRSRAAAKAATRSLEGRFSDQVQALQQRLTHLRVHLEAYLDFPDEEIEPETGEALEKSHANITDQLNQLRESARHGAILRDGLAIAIAGAPNAGKSSLMNRLVGYDAAIVTEFPGTTRDALREQLDLDGLPAQIIDTAGLRETDDPIEQEGLRRAHTAIERADQILWVFDIREGIASARAAAKSELGSDSSISFIANKVDLVQASKKTVSDTTDDPIEVSALTGEGVNDLVAHLKAVAGYSDGTSGTFSARRRHLDTLERAATYVAAAELILLRQPELAAEELRAAQTTLSEITGEFSSDDLLGEIFSSFCIGK